MKGSWYDIFHMWHANWKNRNEAFGKLDLSSYKWKLLLCNEFAGRLSALHLENKKRFLIICL